MDIALCIISAIFGGLSLIAAIIQLRAEKKAMPAILMIVGSIMLIAAVICHFAKQQIDCVLALIGCFAICIAAIRNGLKSESFHIQHHIIRIIFSIVITIGFFLL